jgi:hypothetical protein
MDFKKKYPNLAKELEREGFSIGGVRSDPREAEKAFHKKSFNGYDPTVVDFLRRCDTDEEGLEIIDYMRRRGEIDEIYATKLKMQLLRKGIRSFGPKKEKGYYNKIGL